MFESEELKKALLELAKSLASGKDFVQSQLADVIQQFIVWNQTISLFWAIFSLILLFLSLYVLYISSRPFISKPNKNRKNTFNDFHIAGILTGFSAFVISGYYFLTNLIFFLYIFIAPKLFIIENCRKYYNGQI
jgi:hypothetical protein